LCAVRTNGALGIDIEYIDTNLYFEPITRWLPASDRALVAAQPSSAQRWQFYACWTAREAFFKATGEGLTAAEEPHRLEADLPAGWRARSFVPAPGYLAGIVADDVGDLSWWRWEMA
jgi:hypothetical protein